MQILFQAVFVTQDGKSRGQLTGFALFHGVRSEHAKTSRCVLPLFRTNW